MTVKQFEQHVNQKQMGAYYTKEDISEYIAKNTIIPFLFGTAEEKYPTAFEVNGPIWRLLRENPDRYIYEAVRCESHLLAETDQEYAARRKRYTEIKTRLLAGKIISINDFITYNLDICRFAQDVIENCERDFLRVFYESLEQMTILDPTCGSGVFLLAALKVLDPLYEGCIERLGMTATLQGDNIFPGDYKGSPLHDTTALFLLHNAGASREAVYGRGEACPRLGEERGGSRRYLILKSIILNNLYGVDISKEAIEICKLRLLLKLVACIERMEDIESLPDIDRNIRVGNALIGFASYDETKQATLGEDQLCLQANELRTKLDYYLAREDGIDPNNALTFEQWCSSHQPFHWCVEFDKIMQNGGFDVIIGNPPYVEYSEVKADYRLPVDTYKTGTCGNLYAYCLERSFELLNEEGRWGMIVPLSGFATDRMHSLQQLVMEHSSCLHLSFLSGDANPSKLFAGVKFRLCIGLAKISSLGNRKHGDRKGLSNPTAPPSPLLYDGYPTPISSHREKLPYFTYYSTRYVRWYAEARDTLFSSLQYCQSTDAIIKGSLPKVGQDVELAILKKLTGQPALRSYIGHGDKALYYHNCPVNWIRATTFVPRFQSDRDGMKVSSQIRQVTFLSEELRDAAVCIINSTLFFWFWLLYSDCYHLTEREIGGFPINLDQLAQRWCDVLSSISDRLMHDYKNKSRQRTYVYKTTGRVVYDEFYPKLSKPIIDDIDRVLARYYDFSDEELDFIIHYEIKYRMGRES
ncbi:MAG TPA: DNA methyltransferase [Ktedonobacteraceae bacterium]|nr:DNA methyltransferase [Ktedonobacteraceae bacterium]